MAKRTKKPTRNLVSLEQKELAELEKLDRTVGEVNRRLRKLTSLRFRFVNGIFQGFGMVLGGTIIAWVVITVLVEILRQVNYIPLINTLFESEMVKVFTERLGDLQRKLE